MNARSSLRLGCVLALATLLGACAAPGGGYRSPPYGAAPQPGAGAPLGTLVDIRGPNAFYQRAGAGAPLRASEGQPVYDGDRIFTGAGTRMTLRFARGGHAELDESTDPVPRFLSDLGCLIVDLLRTGRMFVDGSDVCVGALGTIARQDSQVTYDVRPGYAQITVAGGRAQLRRPQAVDIPAGWRVDANARQVMRGGAYQLTRQQVEDAVRWTQWYQRNRPRLPGIAETPVVPRATTAPRTTEPPAQTTAPPAQTPTPPAQTRTPGVVSPPPRAIPRLQRPPQTTPSEVIR